MPLIVVEGIDGSGKSTLIEQLAAAYTELGLEVTTKHFGPPEFNPVLTTSRGEQEWNRLDSVFDDYTDPLRQALLIDRFHWGEPVYCREFRPEQDQYRFGVLGPFWFFSIEESLHEFGGITAWLDVPPKTCYERTMERDDGSDEFLDLHTNRDERATRMIRLHRRYAELAPMCPSWMGPIWPSDTIADDVMEAAYKRMESIG